MPSTQQHLRQLYRAARGLAATARLPDRASAQQHRAAVRAELSGDWSHACALWFEHRASLAAIDAPHARTDKNLAHCALKSARAAEQAKQWAAALQSWDYLRAAEPGSEPAMKGIDRCARQLAVELDGGAHEILALKRPLHAMPQGWKVDVLVRMGLAREAAEHLNALEAALGHTAASRRQRAQIDLHAGNFSEAATAARDAIALLQKCGHNNTSDCPLIWAETLCLQDRHAEARGVLFANLRDHDALTDRDFAALFATARNRNDVDAVRAFLSPNFAAGHKSRASALKQHSIALRDLGFAADAQAIARTRLLEIMAAKPFGHAPRAINTAWSQGAERALLDLKADLDAGGFAFFLISGTLLGSVREGRVLEHDKDLDVGVPADVDMAAMRAHLQTTGRFRIRPLQVQTIVRAIHANGTSIDIFRHWLEDGQMVHQGQKAKWRNTPFTLKSREFLGATFQVPSDPELYLAENYGDWKTPAKDFDTVVDTPNMRVTDRDHLIWYYYTGLHNYYASGSGVRFAKIWAALKDTAPVDAEISSKIAEQLAALDGESKSKGWGT
jgi:hypothetical protein